MRGRIHFRLDALERALGRGVWRNRFPDYRREDLLALIEELKRRRDSGELPIPPPSPETLARVTGLLRELSEGSRGVT